MTFKSDTFDYVIDKGTLDALLSSHDKKAARQEAAAMVCFVRLDPTDSFSFADK
jgi:hypothetical protein